jgi:hypothetical protein
MKGSKNIITQEISISDYDEIQLSVSGEVYYKQTDASPYLELTTDDNIFEYLDIFVKNRVLYIRTIKHHHNINPTKFIVNTNSQNIRKIHLSGSAALNFVSDINTDKLEVNLSGSGAVSSSTNVITANKLNVALSGSGSVKINGVVEDHHVTVKGSGNIKYPNLTAKNLHCKISGSGGVEINGATKQCNIVFSGSGNIKCPDFTVKDLNCKISGSGDVDMTVTKSITCNISGSGSLIYTGDPNLDVKTSGSGRVIKK